MGGGRKSVRVKRKEREKGEDEGERRKRRRGRKQTISSSDLWRFDNQNSSNQGIKSFYAIRAMLQEVGILPTLVYFPP